MAQIPSLLQLCAEKVAALRSREHFEELTKTLLPKINIVFATKKKPNDNEKFVSLVSETNMIIDDEPNSNNDDNTSLRKRRRLIKSCRFERYIDLRMRRGMYRRIISSQATLPDDYEFIITVGSEKMLYISTLASLGGDMLKLDFPEGEYTLVSYNEGYLLKQKNYSHKIQDVIQIFNSIDGDKGLDVDYRYRAKNPHVKRMMSRFITEYIANELWWKNCTNSPYKHIIDFNNGKYSISMIFYLTEYIDIYDLRDITLSCASQFGSEGSVRECRYVIHSVKGKIGVAVLQLYFCDMFCERRLNCRPAVALLANKVNHRAVGNFEPLYEGRLPNDVDHDIFRHGHDYVCEFDPCYCDFSISSEVWPLNFLEKDGDGNVNICCKREQ